MKNLFIAFFLIGIHAVGQKTTTASIKIIPGAGVGKLQIGMTYKQAVSLLGKPTSKQGYTDEMKDFKEQGIEFSIDSIPQFVIGFDEVIVYNEAPANYPVFNLYFKENKLVYFTLSIFVAKEASLKKFAVNNGVRFNDPKKSSLPKFGNEYYSYVYGDYDGDLVFYSRGIELTYDEGKLATISIFKADPNFLNRIADRSATIKEEWDSIEVEN